MANVILLFLSYCCASLAYQLGPPVRTATRVSHAMAATDTKYRLNNYILAGPLTPLGNNVLVKPSKLQEKTRGGLFVQNAACEASQNGLVVAAGPGRTHPGSGELHTCPVEVGDLVLLSASQNPSSTTSARAHTTTLPHHVMPHPTKRVARQWEHATHAMRARR
jgi:chaperonin GroES